MFPQPQPIVIPPLLRRTTACITEPTSLTMEDIRRGAASPVGDLQSPSLVYREPEEVPVNERAKPLMFDRMNNSINPPPEIQLPLITPSNSNSTAASEATEEEALSEKRLIRALTKALGDCHTNNWAKKVIALCKYANNYAAGEQNKNKTKEAIRKGLEFAGMAKITAAKEEISPPAIVKLMRAEISAAKEEISPPTPLKLKRGGNSHRHLINFIEHQRHRDPAFIKRSVLALVAKILDPAEEELIYVDDKAAMVTNPSEEEMAPPASVTQPPVADEAIQSELPKVLEDFDVMDHEEQQELVKRLVLTLEKRNSDVKNLRRQVAKENFEKSAADNNAVYQRLQAAKANFESSVADNTAVCQRLQHELFVRDDEMNQLRIQQTMTAQDMQHEVAVKDYEINQLRLEQMMTAQYMQQQLAVKDYEINQLHIQQATTAQRLQQEMTVKVSSTRIKQVYSQRFQRELAAKDYEIRQLQMLHTNRLTDIQLLQDGLAAKDNEIQLLQHDLAAKDEEIQHLRTHQTITRRTNRAVIDGLEQNLATSRSVLKTLREDTKHINKTLKVQAKHMTLKDTTIYHLNELLERKCNDNPELKAAVDREKAIKMGKAQIKTLKRENEELKNREADLMDKLDTLGTVLKRIGGSEIEELLEGDFD